MTSDADGVYGTGYTFGRAAGNLEGTFMADNETGGRHLGRGLPWRHLLASTRMGDVVYKVGHAHFCGNVVNGFMQTDPWTYYHSMGFTKAGCGDPDPGVPGVLQLGGHALAAAPAVVPDIGRSGPTRGRARPGGASPVTAPM